MTSANFRRMLSGAVAVAATYCMMAPQHLAAATNTTSPTVTYTASGTFATPPIKGSDLFQLQGQRFTISISASESTVAKTHGAQWADYTSLPMTGSVQSGLLPTPISLSNSNTSLELVAGNPSYDEVILYSPVKVVGITLSITATIHLPKGTLKNDHILPFSAVTLNSSNATMTYSDGTNSTELGINGTIVATAK